MRAFDRDLIRGGHYGQRPCGAALTGRTHGCTDQPANVKKTLANSEPSTHGRYCCKSLFALLIKNSPGCRRDFRVKMWGTSSPDDKLTGDLGSVIETTQSGGSSVGSCYGGKIITGQFWTFTTVSAQSGHSKASVCSSAFGAKRTLTEPRLQGAGLVVDRVRSQKHTLRHVPWTGPRRRRRVPDKRRQRTSHGRNHVYRSRDGRQWKRSPKRISGTPFPRFS